MKLKIAENQTNKCNNLAFALCMLSYLIGGTVATLMSAYLPVAIPELLQKVVSEQELGEIGAYLNSSFIYGWMVGGMCMGFLSDKIGRVKALSFSVGLYGLFTLLVVFVPHWQVLLAYRFLAGMGVGGVLLISTVYIAEIWKEDSRPVALGILAVAFPIGIVLTGGLNVVFSYWKQAFWLGVLPLILSILVFALLPESERWKKSKSTKQQTRSSDFSPEIRQNLFLGTLIFGSVLVALWAIFSWIPTWIQNLLAGVSDGQKERGLTMMLLGMGGIVGGVFSGFLIKKLGIRTTLILTFLGCILACCLLFLTNTSFSSIIYLELALLSLFFGISQGSLSSYIPSLFPTIIRATATGFCFNIGRFFTATGVFFVGTLVSLFGGFGNTLSAFSLAFIFALLGTFLSKDTQGRMVE
ncbi:MFS transporter [Thermoflexibacter ruber]|uniref:Predicted arabinose efflux permease, MFS family n=1 Tax=Thermoflexibacter ruber TaxID=1003 RepID=A0A1I2ENI2_9BACT|nr:MFS transporter [Thermoflexibacter ruber]SFE94147.1 Predicted arabinose efflux permease, MFS family [Thermoflexibacter ruber]